eukprot:5080186-Pyramimonas_sp.AAC.1
MSTSAVDSSTRGTTVQDGRLIAKLLEGLDKEQFRISDEGFWEIRKRPIIKDNIDKDNWVGPGITGRLYPPLVNRVAARMHRRAFIQKSLTAGRPYETTSNYNTGAEVV